LPTSDHDPPPPAPEPIELELDRSRSLRIRWRDGAETTIPLAALRRACPCATCRAAREERARNPLSVLPAVPNPLDLVTVRDAELVGRYALKICWNDGHDIGIFDFTLLRSLGQERPAAE
jgi:DUF971 family protein